jgi:hypothetical protein
LELLTPTIRKRLGRKKGSESANPPASTPPIAIEPFPLVFGLATTASSTSKEYPSAALANAGAAVVIIRAAAAVGALAKKLLLAEDGTRAAVEHATRRRMKSFMVCIMILSYS